MGKLDLKKGWMVALLAAAVWMPLWASMDFTAMLIIPLIMGMLLSSFLMTRNDVLTTVVIAALGIVTGLVLKRTLPFICSAFLIIPPYTASFLIRRKHSAYAVTFGTVAALLSLFAVIMLGINAATGEEAVVFITEKLSALMPHELFDILCRQTLMLEYGTVNRDIYAYAQTVNEMSFEQVYALARPVMESMIRTSGVNWIMMGSSVLGLLMSFVTNTICALPALSREEAAQCGMDGIRTRIYRSSELYIPNGHDRIIAVIYIACLLLGLLGVAPAGYITSLLGPVLMWCGITMVWFFTTVYTRRRSSAVLVTLLIIFMCGTWTFTIAGLTDAISRLRIRYNDFKKEG